ncbi:MAG: T9SS type A sorting domain-containing protein [Ginsengibacter sp.]
MEKNFTLKNRILILVTVLIGLFLVSVRTQAAPKIKFRNPELISGIDKQAGATYKFPNVVAGVDAFVTIELMVNGATLVNIDDSTLGYYDAWQPTVGGPGFGSSYIKWAVEFKSNTGIAYTFPDIDASSIDVDGDNASVREFVGINGQASYAVPTQVPSLLTITEVSDTDNIYGDDPSSTNLFALGPVINRTNIDTFSQDVRLDYHFINTSKIKFYTGSLIEPNGIAAGATNRYHCIYFMKIIADFSVLRATSFSFDAMAINNRKVNLSWLTESGKSNDRFEIQRSYDKREFKTIGIIMSQENMDEAAGSYSYEDQDPALSNYKEIFYRIKQFDVYGGFSYSAIKKVSINSNKISFQVMPNPYIDKLSVGFSSETNGIAEVRLFNSGGNMVKKIQFSIVSGNNNLNLQDLKSQAPGLYVIEVFVNGKIIATRKLIKQ